LDSPTKVAAAVRPLPAAQGRPRRRSAFPSAVLSAIHARFSVRIQPAALFYYVLLIARVFLLAALLDFARRMKFDVRQASERVPENLVSRSPAKIERKNLCSRGAHSGKHSGAPKK
jgi:hypothetical protein